MAGIEKYLGAQTFMDPQGNYTYIVNPDTGQPEIAYGGFRTMPTFQPAFDQEAGFFDPKTGRQVVPTGDENNPGWAYFDMYGGPEGMGGAGEPVPGGSAQDVMLPESVAKQAQANPDAFGVQASGVGVVQQDRTKTGLLQQIQSGEMMPQLFTMAAGFGLPAIGGSAFGLGNMISGATGLPGWAGAALGSAIPAAAMGDNPLQAAATSGLISAAWPHLPGTSNSLIPGGMPEFEANSFPDQGPVFTGTFNPNGGPLMPPASPNGDLGGYGASGPVFTGQFNPNGGPSMPPATGQGSTGYTPAQLAMFGLAGTAAAGAGANGDNSGASSSLDQGVGFGATDPNYNLPSGTVEAPPSGFQDFLNSLGLGGAGAALGGVGSALGGAGALAALGGAAGLLGGSKQAGTTTTVQDIPDWLKPYANNLLTSAQGQFNASQTPNPLIGQAQGEMAKTIGGGYLSPESNPYLKGTYDQAAKSVTDSYLSTTQPRNDALFAKSGAFGPSNSAYRETVARNQFGLGENLGNLANNIYGGNYANERNRQFGATTAGPDFATSATGAGFAPFNQYAGLLKGWGQQTTQPFFENKLGSALGGALTGYSLGNLFK
jgi:hypothetical protein